MADLVWPFVVDATNPDTSLLEEEHVRKILIGTYGEEPTVHETIHAIARRMQESDQTVCLKTLVLLHRVLRDGSQPIVNQAVQADQSLMSALISSANLSHDWSDGTLISKYRKYLGSRQVTDGPTAVDATVGRFRHLSAEQLFEQMPKLQTHLAGLLDSQAECIQLGLERDVVAKGFALMMKDAFLYHRCGSEGIVNLLERFFSFELETAENGILVYKQFTELTDRLVETHNHARALPRSISGPYPELQPAPASLLAALEQYRDQLINGDSSAATLSMNDAGLPNDGSFALSTRQLDVVLTKVDKLERIVNENTDSQLRVRAELFKHELQGKMTDCEKEVKQKELEVKAFQGGGSMFSMFGSKKEKTEEQAAAEQAAVEALEVAQLQMTSLEAQLKEAAVGPLRISGEEKMALQLKELKELIIHVAGAANEQAILQTAAAVAEQ